MIHAKDIAFVVVVIFFVRQTFESAIVADEEHYRRRKLFTKSFGGTIRFWESVLWFILSFWLWRAG